VTETDREGRERSTTPGTRARPADRPQTGPIDLLRAFTGLRRNLSLYPPGHRVIGRSLGELARIVERTAPASGHARVELLSGVAHMGGYPFRSESRAHPELVEEWSGTGIECIEIASDVSPDDLLAGARVANALASGGATHSSARRALDEAGVRGVALTRLTPVETTLPSFDWPDAPEKVVARSYADALDLARETVGVAFAGGKLRATGVEALLRKVSGELVDDGVALAEILAVKQYENYTFCHSVHVAALSILLGRRVGLDGDAVSRLGEAALLHDIGKRQIPVEMLRKAGKLTRRERRVIERHPVFGAEILAGTPGLGALTPTIALEHHRHFRGGGYPDLGDRVPHEASQIVAVVDIYEALTGARPYREPLLPDQACLLLARLAGDQLEPALVRAFVSLVSFFPIGSVVRTTLDELGVVVHIHEGDPLHPRVELLAADTLQPTGSRLDLSERDEDGEYVRHVAETLRHAVVPADFTLPAMA